MIWPGMEEPDPAGGYPLMPLEGEATTVEVYAAPFAVISGQVIKTIGWDGMERSWTEDRRARTGRFAL